MTKDKKQIEAFLLSFAIFSIVYCVTFAFIIGIISRDYQNKIDRLQRQLIKNEIEKL
jgi:hypothetical protein